MCCVLAKERIEYQRSDLLVSMQQEEYEIMII